MKRAVTRGLQRRGVGRLAQLAPGATPSRPIFSAFNHELPPEEDRPRADAAPLYTAGPLEIKDNYHLRAHDIVTRLYRKNGDDFKAFLFNNQSAHEGKQHKIRTKPDAEFGEGFEDTWVRPALCLLHGEEGLTDGVISFADQLSYRHGCAVYLPDLFHLSSFDVNGDWRTKAVPIEQSLEAAKSFDVVGALEDVEQLLAAQRREFDLAMFIPVGLGELGSNLALSVASQFPKEDIHGVAVVGGPAEPLKNPYFDPLALKEQEVCIFGGPEVDAIETIARGEHGVVDRTVADLTMEDILTTRSGLEAVDAITDWTQNDSFFERDVRDHNIIVSHSIMPPKGAII